MCPTAPSKKPNIAKRISLCLSIGKLLPAEVERSAICAIESDNVVVPIIENGYNDCYGNKGDNDSKKLPNTVSMSIRYPLFSTLL